MPNDKSSDRHRMVVEEVEIPSKIEETSNTEVINEEAKVSSEELINNENIQLSESPASKETSVFEEKTSHSESIKNIREPSKNSKQNSPVFWILIPGIFILGAILGGIVFYQKNTTQKNDSSTPAPKVSSAPVATTSPTASPSAKISEFNIAIYNGSGISGEAGKVKTLLEDAGFTVVSTGNAATYDYTKTIIKAKADIEASVIKKLKDTLSENYVVGEDQTLSSTSTTDIQVVVGSSKAE